MIPTWFQRGSKTAPTWCQHGSHSEVRLVSWDLTVRFRCRCRCRCCCCSCSCCCRRCCCCCRCRRRRRCCCCCCRHRRRRHCHCRCRCRCRRCRRRSWCFLRRKKAMLRCQITPEKWNPSTKKNRSALTRGIYPSRPGGPSKESVSTLYLSVLGGRPPRPPWGQRAPLAPPGIALTRPKLGIPKIEICSGRPDPPFLYLFSKKKRG
jgi:hypothetical protein